MRSNIKSFESMRKDAASIFQAGLDAIEPAAAVHRHCKCTSNRLRIAGCRFDRGNVNRIFSSARERTAPTVQPKPRALLPTAEPWNAHGQPVWIRNSFFYKTIRTVF